MYTGHSSLSAIFSVFSLLFIDRIFLALPHEKSVLNVAASGDGTVAIIIMKRALDLRLYFMMWVYTKCLGNQ